MPERPSGCCGVCPPIVGGGYDCTCAGNPRCPNYTPSGLDEFHPDTTHNPEVTDG